MLRLQAPEHSGSRQQARELVSNLSPDVSGQSVRLDCGQLLVPTPSFLDEIVKQVLEVGKASCLEIVDASQRARDLITRSAENRGVSTRLKITTGVP